MPSQMAEKTRAKYTGGIAEGYEAKRDGETKWKREEAVLREFMDDLPAGTKVLDIPCGTGRFFSYYAEKGFLAWGMDVSKDMLARAKERRSRTVFCREGDIFKIDLAKGAVDVAVSIRIMNLISPEDMQAALRELQRVARDRIIFNLRVWHTESKYRRPQKMEMVEAALDGWKIERNVEIHQHDFRMIELRPCVG